MATSAELVQSILASLTLAQNTEMSEEEMDSAGVIDILVDMDERASELVEVLG